MLRSRRRLVILAPLGLLLLVGSLSRCTRGPGAIDLLRAGDKLQEADVCGRKADWVARQTGKPVRINDVVRRTLPASPPSRLCYRLDIPRHARLSFACGILEEQQDHPGVEFTVKLRKNGKEDVAFMSVLEPARRAAHRKWVSAKVDLDRFSGRGVDLILETRSLVPSSEENLRTAFWGTPAVSIPNEASAPIAIVYLVDTLRADHTGVYGYPRGTTPHLDTFAKQAVVFETAIAQASWTKPSIASIFTSQLPARHRTVQLRDSLSPGQVTLAEMLETKGFATGAAIANSVIYLKGSNFEKGFDAFVGLHGPHNRPTKIVEAAPVVNAALDWIDSRRGLPTFLYVHTMDPHVPYTPPAPFDRRFPPYPTPDHPAADPRTDYKEPEDRERMIGQYDGEIAYGDQEFGRFVEGLKERGIYDRALIVFLGDHGEEFLDHGKWLHGRSVFDELVRIPLLVKFPGGRDGGRRIARQVQEVDVLPTVLQEMTLPVPAPPAIAGQALQAVINGKAPEPPALSEISHRGYVAHGIRTRADKFVQRFSPQDELGELYFDLVKDPRETIDRTAENAERVRFLRSGLEAGMASNPYRHVLYFTGSSSYELKLRTGGWIEGVEAVGLGLGEKQEIEGSGRKLALKLHPRPGQPREIAFTVRPTGAPVWLEGKRDGRSLSPADVFIAQEAVHPEVVPFHLPEIETFTENEVPLRVFDAPATDRPGLYLWLRATKGRQPIDLSKDNCETLRALGYIGSCGQK